MKQRLLSFFALAALAMSAMAQSWTAPVEPTPIEPLDFGFTPADYEIGGTYYIQNVGTGQFVTGANNWATQISVSSNGIPYVSVLVEEVTDAGYEDCIKLKLNGSFKFDGNATGNYRKDYAVADTYFFRDSEANGFVDRNNQAVWYWFFEKAESGNYYWHSAPGMGDNKFPNSAEQYASVTGPGVGVNFSTGIEAANNEWCFIPLESVDMEAVNAAQEEYNIKLDAYNTALAIYNARVPLYEMLNDAVKYNADYTEAGAVYDNADATADEITAATEALRPLVAKALVAYINANPDVENPINLTKYLLTNADFSAGDLTGWTIEKPEGATGNYQYQGATYKSADESVIIQGFIESWVPAPNTLNDGKMYQKVGGLPNGRYTLECDANALNQNSPDSEKYIEKEDYTGVYLYYSDGKISLHGDALASDRTDTENEETGAWTTVWHPAHFTYTFDLSTESDTITVGLMIDNTNLNWIGADNFQLTYVGTVQSLPSYTALVAEVAAAESYLETEPYAQAATITALQEALAAAKPLTTAASDDSKDAEYQAAYAQLNGARQTVVESVAAYKKLESFLETIDADIERYGDKAGYGALVTKLSTLQEELTAGYDKQTISAEEISAQIDGYADMIAANIQKLFDDAVAAGESIEEGLDISPLFKDMTFAYGTTQTAFANGYPAENPVWMNETKTGNFKTNYSTAEVWDARPFNIYRDLENLPKGKYTVKTHAFYRVAGNDTNYPGYQNGNYEDTEYAYIYAGANHTPIVNVASIASENLSSISSPYDCGDGNYLPNNQLSAHMIFTDSQYAAEAEQCYIGVSGNVLADGGTLRIGFAGTDQLQANHWCIFDGFEIYYNGVPETLDGEIEALIEELQNYAPFIVETTNLYNAAIEAANAALGADREMQVAAIAQLEEAIAACKLSEELYNQLIDVVLPEYEKKLEDSYGKGTFTDKTFSGIINEIRDAQAKDSFESNAQMQGWLDALPSAWMDYVLSMAELDDATIEEPVELPILVNADFTASNHTEGWTIETDATSGNRGDYASIFLEFWNTNGTSWKFSQELPRLKEGYYRLSTDGLYRAAGTVAATDSLKAGNVKQHVYLFAGEVSTPLMAWTDMENGALPGLLEDLKAGDYPDLNGTEYTYENVEGETVNFVAPNDRASLKTFVDAGRYHNELLFGYTSGPITVGLKQTKVYSSDWAPFGPFKLEYLGTEAPDAVTSLEAEPAKAMSGALYSIDGRIVRHVTSAADLRGLSRGIYIIGGKKVTIQ